MTSAPKSQRVSRNIFGNDRTCADIRAIAHAHGRDQRRIAADKNPFADSRGIFVHAVVVARNCAGADIRAGPHARVAQIGQVHGFDAFAEHALFYFHEISHARVFFQARAIAEMRERTNLRSARKVAGNHHRVRLDEHVVFKHSVRQDAAGANRAACADARLSQQLHARLDARIGADGDFRIDQDRFRHLDGHARIHDGRSFPATIFPA